MALVNAALQRVSRLSITGITAGSRRSVFRSSKKAVSRDLIAAMQKKIDLRPAAIKRWVKDKMWESEVEYHKWVHYLYVDWVNCIGIGFHLRFHRILFRFISVQFVIRHINWLGCNFGVIVVALIQWWSDDCVNDVSSHSMRRCWQSSSEFHSCTVFSSLLCYALFGFL